MSTPGSASQTSHPRRQPALPSSWRQQPNAPMDNKYGRISRRTPGAVWTPTNEVYIVTNLKEKRKPKIPCSVFIVNQKQQSGVPLWLTKTCRSPLMAPKLDYAVTLAEAVHLVSTHNSISNRPSSETPRFYMPPGRLRRFLIGYIGLSHTHTHTHTHKKTQHVLSAP